MKERTFNKLQQKVELLLHQDSSNLFLNNQGHLNLHQAISLIDINKKNPLPIL